MLVMGLQDEFREAVPILANMTFALEEVSQGHTQSGVPVPYLSSLVQGVLCSVLRDGDSVPRRATLRVRAVRRAYLARQGR